MSAIIQELTIAYDGVEAVVADDCLYNGTPLPFPTGGHLDPLDYVVRSVRRNRRQLRVTLTRRAEAT